MQLDFSEKQDNTLSQKVTPNDTVIDRHDQLYPWQEKFCQMSGVYACCLDGEGKNVTDFSGPALDVNEIGKHCTPARIQAIYSRVAQSGIEDQAVEITDVPNLRLAAVAIKQKSRVSAVWILCACLTDAEYDLSLYHQDPITSFKYQITEKEFYDAMDMLRETMHMFDEAEFSRREALEVSRVSKQQEREMTDSFHRAETMTEIVSYLDSDDSIETLMADILGKLCDYLGISNAFMCRMHQSDELMDIVVQRNAEGTPVMFENTVDQERLWFIGSNQPTAISSTTQMNAGEREQLEQYGIKAVIAMPIRINNAVGFYACLSENLGERVWSIDDIKFINDAIKILQSIITRRIQKNSLAGSFAALESVLDNVGSSIYVRDTSTGLLLFANRSLRSNFTKELKEGQLESLFEANIPAKSHSGNYEIHHEERNRWYDLYYTRIKWVDGRPVSLCAIYDITEKKVYQKKIELQAYTDFLTGLYNRMCCERDLAKYIDEAHHNGQVGALMYLDLDDFKHINDGLGHQYGDVLLRDISHAINEIKGIQGTCYRMGGDEFVIIVPTAHFGELDRIVNDIRQAFSTPWYLKDSDYYCTMSMGIVEFPADGDNVSELIKKADIAMYAAKKSGKNQISRYSSDIDSSSIRRLDLEKSMRDAAIRSCDEFEIYYQPIVNFDGKNNPCVGAEALVRWNSSKLGFLSPSEFIPLAEYLGLINPIGDYVLQKACETCHEWNVRTGKNFFVNVNMSVVQLTQPEIVDKVRECIEKNSLHAHDLVLEMTERLAINDLDRTKQVLMNLKSLGCRLALDDFGTGYSSLNSIRALPFDIIKVDQSFAKDLTEDDYSKAFIKMVAELGETLGAEVCVEGIETATQLNALTGMKVRYIQGFYFDKPLTKEEFEKKYITMTLEPSDARKLGL